jgi:hypothetical protein
MGEILQIFVEKALTRNKHDRNMTYIKYLEWQLNPRKTKAPSPSQSREPLTQSYSISSLNTEPHRHSCENLKHRI